MHDICLMIFRRDLRTIDNPAVNFAASNSTITIPIFIFDPEQISSSNKWRSLSSMNFMLESLIDLQKQLSPSKLHFYKGTPHRVVSAVIKSVKQKSPNASIVVCFNSDYTPYSKSRDNSIAKKLEKLNVHLETFHDLLLTVSPMESPYKKFTPFYKAFSKSKYITPSQTRNPKWVKPTNSLFGVNSAFCENLHKIDDFEQILGSIILKQIKTIQKSAHKNPSIFWQGGRAAALKVLKKAKQQKHYPRTRDVLSITTTRLSAHNKFGTVSIREVYLAFKKISPVLIQQLYWREFYYNLMATDPNALHTAYSKTANIHWGHNYNITDFNKWKQGMTGFPIVDAAMREINTTNYMHNRARMIVASFLIKDLHLNWRLGEQYFAKQLIDYDPAQNNYNWQWVAGTGPFASPYFRIFNPWSQSVKHDPDCLYIKHWLPELEHLPEKIIHKWHEYANLPKNLSPEETLMVQRALKKYPKSMLDHDEAAKKYIKLVNKFSKN